eukprot:gene6789-4066_t
MSLLMHDLHTPEQLVIDTTKMTAYEGPWLYWGDSGVNKIQRCQAFLESGLGATPNCSHGVQDVVTDVRHVAGLALSPGAGSLLSSRDTLYWADGAALRVYSATLDRDTGAIEKPSLLTLINYVTLPSFLALEAAATEGGTSKLWWIDQSRPPRVQRLWLNGNGTDLIEGSGFSRPTALGFLMETTPRQVVLLD